MFEFALPVVYDHATVCQFRTNELVLLWHDPSVRDGDALADDAMDGDYVLTSGEETNARTEFRSLFV